VTELAAVPISPFAETVRVIVAMIAPRLQADIRGAPGRELALVTSRTRDLGVPAGESETGAFVLEALPAAEERPIDDSGRAPLVLGVAGDARFFEGGMQALSPVDGELERLVVVAAEAQDVSDSFTELVTLGAIVRVVPLAVRIGEWSGCHAKKVLGPGRRSAGKKGAEGHEGDPGSTQ
jgi:hypothetical protein